MKGTITFKTIYDFERPTTVIYIDWDFNYAVYNNEQVLQLHTLPSEPAENTLLWVGAAASAFTSPLCNECACKRVPCLASQNWTLPLLSALTSVPDLNNNHTATKMWNKQIARMHSCIKMWSVLVSVLDTQLKRFNQHYLKDSNDHIQSSCPLPKPPSPAVIL